MNSKYKYVITPGLTDCFFNFFSHCRAAENSPIMIVGSTGVGKSLFLHAYKKFLEIESSDNKTKKPEIVWANCAHFGGVNSDPNIARAELFGIKKNTLQGITVDKKGLVGNADGGALILEEIGELPPEVQSMLLTFIESGEYREVGGDKTKYANIRIVGATNREENLRDDLRYRFFPFYLPDLVSRRGDVLYYLSHLHPDLLPSLTKSEVLRLLAYHWPGNVREIDRVVRLIYRDKIRSESFVFDTPEMKSRFQLKRFDRLNERETPISRGTTVDLLDTISAWGCDSEFLESLLNRLKVGLSHDDPSPAFDDYQSEFEQHYKEQEGLEKFEKKYEVRLLLPIKQFEDAYKGYLAFCGLFMQDPNKNCNIFEQLDGGRDMDYPNLGDVEYAADEKEQVDKLFGALASNPYLIQCRDSDLDDQEEYLAKNQVDTTEESPREDLFNLPEKELRKRYYQELLRKTYGNVKAAAEIAGEIPQTFRSRVESVGIDLKKRRRKKNKI